MIKSISLFTVFLLSSFCTQAQEFKCKVNVMADQIQGIDVKVFKTMEQGLSDFVNNRKWTNDNFEVKEKIECVITIVVNKAIAGEEGGFTGKIMVQSTRPVFSSTYLSPIINYTDKDLAFRYIQFQTIDFSDSRVSNNDALASNLPAVVAYYCYIMLGLDYESFAKKSGTDFFNKALNIVNNAPENKSISGWSATENQRNRFWIIDQMLNSRFSTLRESYYTYHREGMDMLSSEPDKARIAITNLIPIWQQVNAENPSSIFIQFFFNAKGEEIINFLEKASKEDKQKFVPILVPMDLANSNKYADLLK